jgi:hypothetical protein
MGGRASQQWGVTLRGVAPYSLLAPAPPQPPSTEVVPGQQPVDAEVMPVEVMPVKNQQVTEIRGAGV